MIRFFEFLEYCDDWHVLKKTSSIYKKYQKISGETVIMEA